MQDLTPDESALTAVAKTFGTLWKNLASVPLEALNNPQHPGWSEPFASAAPLVREFDAAVSRAKAGTGVLAPLVLSAVQQAETLIGELVHRLNERSSDRLPVVLLPACMRVGDELKNLAKLHQDPLNNPAAPENLPAGQQPDGPEGGCRVWFQGKFVEVTGRVYQVIHFFWGRDSATFDALFDAVGESVQCPTVHTWANRVNTVLQPLGLVWKLKVDSTTRWVRKVPR